MMSVVVLTWCILIYAVGIAHSDIYCEEDTFTTDCQEGEVILITSARHGRMELNRCVTTNHNYLGCNTNCLSYVDSLCSGKKSCSIKVFDLKTNLKQIKTFDRTNKCPTGLVQYLNVEYRCIKVMEYPTNQCYTAGEVPVTSESGYIASSVTKETSIGSNQCPYIFNIDTGKKLNITLLNFAKYKEADTVQICPQLARVWSGTNSNVKEITLCDDNGRGSFIGVFSSPVKIEIFTEIDMTGNFLLQYEATGCANVKPRANTVFKRYDNTLTVNCNTTKETRYLVCKGDQWSGEIQDCPKERTTAELWSTGTEEFPIGILIVVAIGVALGVFLGGITLVAVSIHMKKKQDEKRRQLVYMTPPQEFSPMHAEEMHGALQRDCAQCTIERVAHHQQPQTKVSTYIPTSSVEGSIKDYSMFDKNALHEAAKRGQNLTSSTRTLPHRSHMYELPASNNNRLT